MKEIHLTDKIYGDLIRIFKDDQIAFDDQMHPYIEKKGFIVTKYVSEERGESLTFADCVDIAKKNGFTIGIFYIMAEKPLEGTVYQYANCYDQKPFVSEYGKTRGYA